ncbi:hypothetical protein QR674_01795 [Acinetobacter chinensis]|uniref:DUF11 domain-containing protein n=1 Tax=Acinetobacter chinensis TaxID=2004650 RepID=A0ABU3WBE5_9GAMM|nr:hypothetical protein [Acinetobacter chinensis]MDV2467717.1 hypothetical protein [Acinetobacter chinensis]
MFTEKMITRSLRWAMSGLLGATVSTFALADTAAVISNMATGEYKEEGSTVVQTSRSNLVRTTIIPTYSFTLTSDNTIDATLNQTVYFNHVLTNTANAEDTFTLGAVTNNGAVALSQIVVYLDKDRNGVPDSDQPVTQYSLNAGEAVALIVKAVVGATGAVGAGGSLKITATSAQSGVAAQSNTDTVTITDKAVLSIRKSFNKDIVVKDDEAIVRLTYQNMGTESGEVNITDVLNLAELTYVPGSEVWNGLKLNPANNAGDDQVGINYYLDTDGKTVRAKITNVPANAQGYIEFKVKVVKGTPGQIPNFADMTFDHDKNTVTPGLTAKSNTAILEIKPVYGVVINADASTASNVNDIDSRGPLATGSTVLFNNWVWNTGNAADRFNLTMGTHNFPAGTVLEFFREDGITPLFDTNGDGVVDTGYIKEGEQLPVVVKATFPKDYIDTANTLFEVKPVAQSIADSSKTDDVTDRVTLFQNDLSRIVDLTNDDNTGLGNGNVSKGTTAAWKNLSGDNGKTVTFPLQVSHVGGLATSYQFSADDDGVFSTLKLPAGVSGVRYYETTDNCVTPPVKEISSTRVLKNGETQTYCAVVSLDATAATGTVDIYFRVTSSELPAPNAQNAYDTIHNSISITSKNSQGGITLDPDLRGQIAPGGTITYTHILKPWGEQVLKATDTLTVTNDQQGFITTLYFDKNDNGTLDAEDVLMTDLSAVPSATLTDKKPVRIFAKVENSSLGTVGITNTSVISLSDGSTVLDTATDITTIATSPVRLSKLQAKDDDCNGAEEGSFTTGVLPITKNADGSGQCVIYKLTVTNMGASDIGRFTFYDATPEAMVMSKAPVCADCDAASITAPAVGQSGEIKGSVPAVKSGASHTLEFGVKYVGN